MRVKGEISGNEDLLVDGKVEGPISVGEHKLTVGHDGQVTGGLAARCRAGAARFRPLSVQRRRNRMGVCRCVTPEPALR
jgi:hypothetical protein